MGGSVGRTKTRLREQVVVIRSVSGSSNPALVRILSYFGESGKPDSPEFLTVRTASPAELQQVFQQFSSTPVTEGLILESPDHGTFQERVAGEPLGGEGIPVMARAVNAQTGQPWILVLLPFTMGTAEKVPCAR